MGAYKYIQETFQKEYKERGADYKKKITAWRNGPATVRLDRPTNIARARRLGYKAKQGYVAVVVRVPKGRRTRRRPMGGRKTGASYIFVQPQQSHQVIAEKRANIKYKNLEVLNSYWVGDDGNYSFYEVLLADPQLKTVNAKSIQAKGRAFRGLTAAGRKSRGASDKSGSKFVRA
ncbi:MAG: 50S ribosomal protein L15e [Candidatus Micrarchaeota archaeon]